MTNFENSLLLEVKKLEAQNAIMRSVGTREGFFKVYFETCKNSKSNKEAFETVNDLYFSFFGMYRYNDYVSFKNITNYYNNQPTAKAL